MRRFVLSDRLFIFDHYCATLIFAKVPELAGLQTTKLNTKQFLTEAREGWSYLMGQSAFKWLLFFSAFINFLLGFINVLLQPLIIGLSSEQTLGVVLSVTGIGMLFGGILFVIVTAAIYLQPKVRIWKKTFLMQ
ncbi:hypothetical protein [Alkalihalobacterium alkalinitrilicum]|uniref:hypothetical protein n=1 Tax=Alkalihalobacterium alkalinitrilicum TaxID=427920 RepID=UPI001C567697|nr:hypothetical protein [Alkalihalobacterium alkalinitrilicum]